MHGLGQDFRVALRQLWRRPWWSASIVAVLAIGLAGNSVMFSSFDTWVLRPLDFERPEELLQVGERHRLSSEANIGMSAADLDDLRRSQTAIAALGAFRGATFNLADEEGEPASVNGALIDGTLFPLLGVRPAQGRLFTADEDLPGQPAAVALISDRLWRERFASAPDVLGRTLRLDGRVHEVVGVMPRGFEFPAWEQVWAPLGLDPAASRRDARSLAVIGRLAPGHTLETASMELAAVGAEVARLHPATHDGWSFEARPLRKLWVPDVIELALAVSLGSALLVLLVICANVASLFLAAAEPRARELALRAALGGGGLQLARPLLFEGAVLGLLGGGLGVGLAVLWQRAMMSRVPLDPPYLFAMGQDLRAGLVTLALAVGAGLLCGFAPFRRSSASGASAELRGARSSGGRRGSRLRGGLVIAELALSTALVAGAMLMVKSFLRQQHVDGGYRAEGLHVAQLALTAPGLEEAGPRAEFLARLDVELAKSPLVANAGVATDGPAERCDGGIFWEADGRVAGPGEVEGVPACQIAVAGDYFETIELPLVAGRGFAAEELERGGDVAVVSEGLARRLWGSSDVLGRRLRRAGDETGESNDPPLLDAAVVTAPAATATRESWLRVVGVVGDVTPPRDMVGPGASPAVQVYRPYPELPYRGVALLTRGTASAEQLATVVRDAIRAAGAPVAVAEVLTLDQALDRERWVTRFFSEQLAIYAGAALLVAALGVYGLIADAVARRRHELAVRLALGAHPREVVGVVARWGLLRVSAGIAVGLGLGLWVSRLAAAMLVDVKAWDPVVFLLVAVVLALAASAATVLPARRAARCDPATLLREG